MTKPLGTDWLSLTAVPYPDAAETPLPCGRCGAPLPRRARLQVVTEGADADMIEALAAGRLNEIACVACGFAGDFGEPVLWVDRRRARSILVYEVDTAPQPEEETRVGVFALLAELGAPNLALLARNSMTVPAVDFAGLRDASDELFKTYVDSARRCDARKGVFGEQRVELICRDIQASDLLIVSHFERSDELLGCDEIWTSEEARRIRRGLRGERESELETIAIKSGDRTGGVFDRLRAAFAPGHSAAGSLTPALRAVAMLADSRVDMTPPERERVEQQAGKYVGLVEPMRTLINQWSLRSPQREEPISIDDEADKLRFRDVMASVAGLDQRTVSWERMSVTDAPEELVTIADALNNHRREEALERAEKWVRTCSEEHRRIADLIRASAALACGREYGYALSERAIDLMASAAEASRTIDRNELEALAYTHRCRASLSLSRGRAQDGLNDNLVSLDAYRTLRNTAMIAAVASELFAILLFSGRREQARELAKNITGSAEVLAGLSRHTALEMFRNVALMDTPIWTSACSPTRET